MARYRSRSRSYSPRRRSRTPPRGRKRYEEEPRDRYHDSKSYRDRRSPAPSGLLVRNLPLDARPEDLRAPFERFGQVKDVYLMKNYYSGNFDIWLRKAHIQEALRLVRAFNLADYHGALLRRTLNLDIVVVNFIAGQGLSFVNVTLIGKFEVLWLEDT
uniref:RRM domain-containing protein n=1 Tax=Fagus sylvatica TaxID=28930 RepID=A0A2N9HIC7_FAGSY